MLTPTELEAIEDLWPFQRELDIQTKQLLSVTGILRRAGLVRFHIAKEPLAKLANNGKDIHLVCEDIARRQSSDYWTALPEVAPFARGFLKFCADFDFQPELIEEPLKHPFMGYTGRLDLAGFVFAGSRSRCRAAIIDVKLGVPSPSHPYQTVAYAELVNRSGLLGPRRIVERWCVYLQPEKYAVKQHTSPADFPEFSAMLVVARVRQAAGLVNERDEREFDDLLRNAGRFSYEPQL